MSGTLYRMLALGALCASVTTGAFAQTAVDTDHDAVISGSQAVCGTDLFNDGGEREALAKTARNHPDLYRKMLVDMKNRNTRVLTAGDEYPFLVRNRVTGEYDEISATLVYEGPQAKIFVDNADMTRIKKTTTDAIGKALEASTVNGSRNTGQGIITNDVQVSRAASSAASSRRGIRPIRPGRTSSTCSTSTRTRVSPRVSPRSSARWRTSSST
jgi:hypothetical protein